MRIGTRGRIISRLKRKLEVLLVGTSLVFFFFFFLILSFVSSISGPSLFHFASSMLPLVKRVVLAVLGPAVFLYQLLNRVFWLGLNERSVIGLPVNFFINFLPVFIWLLIFKNAGLIPKDIRPTIHVALAHRVEQVMFDVWENPLLSLLSLVAITLAAWVLYAKVYLTKRESDSSLETSSSSLLLLLLPSSLFSDEDLEMVDYENPKAAPSDPSVPANFQDHPKIGLLPYIPKFTQHDAVENATSINRRLKRHMNERKAPSPFNCWPMAPPALLAASWLLLNLDESLAQPITETKDTVAWFSYVIGHFCVPLFTAIWLYVFHPPGALKCFGFALGAQNIAGVLTHLLFPTAPPWFIHKFGDDAEASYDTLGYAAGLTRAKFSTGTHLVNNGFHKSPIVFGAVPSLHSAMAVICFFFVCYYSRWVFAKALLLAFVFCQWWATIYLDHHWRIDLFVGLGYAIASYTVFSKWLMPRVDQEFAQARLHYDFNRGSTMGMRVFRNTKLQNFFDPMA